MARPLNALIPGFSTGYEAQGLLGLYHWCPNLRAFGNAFGTAAVAVPCSVVRLEWWTCWVSVCLEPLEGAENNATLQAQVQLPESVFPVEYNTCRDYNLFHPKPAPGLAENSDLLYRIVLAFPGMHVGNTYNYWRSVRVLAPTGSCFALIVFLLTTIAIFCPISLASSFSLAAFVCALLAAALAALCVGVFGGVVYAQQASDIAALGPAFYFMIVGGALELLVLPLLLIWATMRRDSDSETGSRKVKNWDVATAQSSHLYTTHQVAALMKV